MGIVIGQVEKFFTQTGKYYRESSDRVDFYWGLLLPLCVLLAVTVIVLLVRWFWFGGDRPCNDPRRLFRRLCQQHNLNTVSRKLLWRLAEERSPKHPARVFLEPSWFDPLRISPKLKGRGRELEALREHLFDVAAFESTRAGVTVDGT
ncbi:MAG: hypothetical protein HYS13_11470 [Planctomycetia bacterium]|nr:hypothetical protein [Planctomycetia bacterium]